MEEYEELSGKISKLFIIGENPEDNPNLLSLLLKRSNILNNAKNKIGELSNLIDEQKDISHALFYCAPGQLKRVMYLLGKEKKLRVHQFTYHEDNNTRQRILEEFDKRLLQGIVAIKCLDEGVDVPSTKSAFILASSSNPREFIQRRGRILRKSAGKEHAVIYDFITFPPLDIVNSFPSERKIIRKEMTRFKEFAQYAINFNSAYETIWETAKRFNILDF
jgi:superfamily II DNA or RNA helicase